jgi:hypothetical protein
MVKAACIFSQRAQQESVQVSWHGCIDHLLNLKTKIHLKTLQNAARGLVGHYSSSPQAGEILLNKQIPGSAIKCIQDVTTYWWSTY